MDCIVNVTEGWAIGNGGALQITIREDKIGRAHV